MKQSMEVRLKEKMESYQDEMLFHLKELLKIKSVREKPLVDAPYGLGCRATLDYILSLSESFGLRTVNLDNHIGYSEYGEGEAYVCSIAHLDVVPAEDGWDYPPFDAVEEEGILYSRGAGDCKPGNIVGLYALRCLKELEYTPKRKIRVIYGCAEETGQEDLTYYLQREALPVFGITPDSDGYDIIHAEKGRIEFSISAEKGDNCHIFSARGGTVSNIVPEMMEVVFDKEVFPAEKADNILQETSYENTIIEDMGNAVKISFVGKSAHAAMPEGSVNAISLYSEFCRQVLPESCDPITSFLQDYVGMSYSGELLGIDCHDEEMGDLTICVSIMEIDAKQVRAIGDIRFPASISKETICQCLREKTGPLGISLEILSSMDSMKAADSIAYAIYKMGNDL